MSNGIADYVIKSIEFNLTQSDIENINSILSRLGTGSECVWFWDDLYESESLEEIGVVITDYNYQLEDFNFADIDVDTVGGVSEVGDAVEEVIEDNQIEVHDEVELGGDVAQAVEPDADGDVASDEVVVEIPRSEKNIFAIVGACGKALRELGRDDDAKALSNDALDYRSYDKVIEAVNKFVTLKFI